MSVHERREPSDIILTVLHRDRLTVVGTISARSGLRTSKGVITEVFADGLIIGNIFESIVSDELYEITVDKDYIIDEKHLALFDDFTEYQDAENEPLEVEIIDNNELKIGSLPVEVGMNTKLGYVFSVFPMAILITKNSDRYKKVLYKRSNPVIRMYSRLLTREYLELLDNYSQGKKLKSILDTMDDATHDETHLLIKELINRQIKRGKSEHPEGLSVSQQRALDDEWNDLVVMRKIVGGID